nr:hypothetical protein [Xanthomonas sacchari]
MPTCPMRGALHLKFRQRLVGLESKSHSSECIESFNAVCADQKSAPGKRSIFSYSLYFNLAASDIETTHYLVLDAGKLEKPRQLEKLEHLDHTLPEQISAKVTELGQRHEGSGKANVRCARRESYRIEDRPQLVVGEGLARVVGVRHGNRPDTRQGTGREKPRRHGLHEEHRQALTVLGNRPGGRLGNLIGLGKRHHLHARKSTGTKKRT